MKISYFGRQKLTLRETLKANKQRILWTTKNEK